MPSNGKYGHADDGTTVKQKILRVLEDGRDHHTDELYACLWDQESDDKHKATTLSVHLVNLRRELRPRAQDISTIRLGGRTYYRWVRLVQND